MEKEIFENPDLQKIKCYYDSYYETEISLSVLENALLSVKMKYAGKAVSLDRIMNEIRLFSYKKH